MGDVSINDSATKCPNCKSTGVVIAACSSCEKPYNCGICRDEGISERRPFLSDVDQDDDILSERLCNQCFKQKLEQKFTACDNCSEYSSSRYLMGKWEKNAIVQPAKGQKIICYTCVKLLSEIATFEEVMLIPTPYPVTESEWNEHREKRKILNIQEFLERGGRELDAPNESTQKPEKEARKTKKKVSKKKKPGSKKSVLKYNRPNISSRKKDE